MKCLHTLVLKKTCTLNTRTPVTIRRQAERVELNVSSRYVCGRQDYVVYSQLFDLVDHLLRKETEKKKKAGRINIKEMARALFLSEENTHDRGDWTHNDIAIILTVLFNFPGIENTDED